MKTFQLHKNSWHYKLAKLGGFQDAPWDRNICAYSHAVALGFGEKLAVVVAWSLAIVVLTYLLVEAAFSLAFSLYYGFNMYNIPAVAGTTLVLACLAGFLWDTYITNRTIKPDGFIKIWYNSYKHKYCVPIELVE